MPLISIFYLILVLVYLAIGAAIIFHMLYYRINRKVATGHNTSYFKFFPLPDSQLV